MLTPLGLFHLVDGQLRIAVEGMDLFNLISEESEPVGMVQRIGKYVDDGAADGILARGRYEVHTLESLLYQRLAEGIIRNFLSHTDGQERAGDLFLFRHRLFQSRRIGDDEQGTFARIHDLADGGRPLNSEGRLIIAPFHRTAAVRQEKDTVAFHQVIQVGTAILGRFPVGKDDQMGSFFRDLGEDEPTGRQKQPAAECFPGGIHSAAEQGCR